jgi:hypothetical protein
LGRTAFNEWVKIYKGLANLDPALIEEVRLLSQEHFGKSLTKVNIISVSHYFSYQCISEFFQN